MKTHKGHLKCLCLELHLNPWFKWAPLNLLLFALAQTTSHTHAMFMHHNVAYACVWFPTPFLLDRSCSGECSRVPVWGAVPPVDLPGKQTPLFIVIQSYSLAPALSYCIRTTTIQLLHAVVVEPLSSAWPVIATVNSWDPLACVGVDWAMLCSCHAMPAIA